jgi:hypothetical protein
MIGRIYHVVDKITGEVVKVGSTTQTLERRFSYPDYRKKYTNYFIREAKILESSEFDWYDADDPNCPFLWHLVASEHMEILKQGTFKKSRFSNRVSPLDQKYFGFDPFLYGAVGGHVSGKKNVESGHWATLRTPEIIMMGAKAAGALAARTGQINKIKTYESCLKGALNQSTQDKARGGYTQGKKNVESGHLNKARKSALHSRWHTKGSTTKSGKWVEAKPSPRCVFCSEQNLIIAFA